MTSKLQRAVAVVIFLTLLGCGSSRDNDSPKEQTTPSDEVVRTADAKIEESDRDLVQLMNEMLNAQRRTLLAKERLLKSQMEILNHKRILFIFKLAEERGVNQSELEEAYLSGDAELKRVVETAVPEGPEYKETTESIAELKRNSANSEAELASLTPTSP